MKKSIIILCSALLATVAAGVLSVSCSKGGDYGPADSLSSSSDGRGGSMARFTIVGDYLYTVDETTLKVVSLTDPATPVELRSIDLGWDIETIFSMGDYLFIGSRSTMFIYDISRPAFPREMSATSHFRSCDPVVAYGNLAFVTLNSTTGRWCGVQGDRLQVYNITSVSYPVLMEEIPMSSPRGLAVDGGAGMVFVCEKSGVSAWSFATSQDPGTSALTVDVEGLYMSGENPAVGSIDAYDCIVLDGTLLVIGADGLYQLGYDSEKFTLISKIDLRRE